MLKPDCIDADASTGASCAASSTTVCTTGTSARLSAPTANAATGANTGECTAATEPKSTSDCAASTTTAARRLSIRSASRPPRNVPAVMPSPNRPSITGTAAGDRRDPHPPPDAPAEHGRRGHADEVRHGEPEEQPPHRRRAAGRPGEIGGDERGDAEERAVRQPGEEPGREQG